MEKDIGSPKAEEAADEDVQFVLVAPDGTEITDEEAMQSMLSDLQDNDDVDIQMEEDENEDTSENVDGLLRDELLDYWQMNYEMSGDACNPQHTEAIPSLEISSDEVGEPQPCKSLLNATHASSNDHSACDFDGFDDDGIVVTLDDEVGLDDALVCSDVELDRIDLSDADGLFAENILQNDSSTSEEDNETVQSPSEATVLELPIPMLTKLQHTNKLPGLLLGTCSVGSLFKTIISADDESKPQSSQDSNVVGIMQCNSDDDRHSFDGSDMSALVVLENDEDVSDVESSFIEQDLLQQGSISPVSEINRDTNLYEQDLCSTYGNAYQNEQNTGKQMLQHNADSTAQITDRNILPTKQLPSSSATQYDNRGVQVASSAPAVPGASTSMQSWNKSLNTGNVSTSQNLLRSYIRTEKHTCDTCGLQYKFKTGLLNHLRKVHGKVNVEPVIYTCSVCNMKFPCPSKLTNHVRKHGNTKAYRCSACGKLSKCLNTMESHVLSCKISKRPPVQQTSTVMTGSNKSGVRTPGPGGVDVKTAPNVSASPVKNNKPDKLPEKVHCAVCKKGFSCPSKLTIHMVVHSNVKPYACSKCSKSFKYEHTLKYHQRVCLHDMPKEETSSCMYDKPAEKKSINQSEDKPQSKAKKPAKCEICHKEFRSRSTLKHLHMAIHEGKQYKCDTCGRVFTTKHYLTRHMKTHVDKSTRKKFPCEICGKMFVSLYYLKYHLLIHNNDTRYMCYICGHAFAQSIHLKKHIASHENKREHLCDLCGRGFNNQQALKRHRQRPHPIRGDERM